MFRYGPFAQIWVKEGQKLALHVARINSRASV